MELKERIKDQMMSSYSNSLEKNFELAKNFIRITKEGKVDVIVKDKINVKFSILLYLIGKLYSKEGSLSETEFVGSKEFMEELGLPSGTFWRSIKELKDKNKVNTKTNKGVNSYTILISSVEKVLKMIKEKIEEGDTKNE